MIRVKMTIGVVAVACALCVMAAPGMAAEFKTTGGVTRGLGEEQTFRLGPFKIACERAVTAGAAKAGSPKTIVDEIKFGKCKTEAKLGTNPIFLRTVFSTPLDVEYHANGFVEIGSELEGAESEATLSGGTIEIKVDAVNCVITLPTQTLPVKAEKKPEGEYFEAAFTNETYMRGSGKGEKEWTRLVIANTFGGIHFSYGSGQCETFTKAEEELRNGKYEGTLTDEIVKGNLEWSAL
jgi:hypothetical protein